MVEKIKPGRELDELVTKAMGLDIVDDDDWGPDGPRQWSTDPAVALEAWDWLEKHNPWPHSALYLGRHPDVDSTPPGVIVSFLDDIGNLKIWVGETYPHAIAIAIVEVGKLRK